MSYGMSDFLADIRDSKVDPVEAAYEALAFVDVKKLERAWRRLLELRLIRIKSNSKRARAVRGKLANHTGRMFERVVRILLDDCKVLKHGGNVRTTVAEIDFLMQYGPLATVVPMFRDAGTHSLGEAKCVTGSLKTEWVSELAGLMPLHNTNVAILFTAAPSKKLGAAARYAISLHAIRGIKIVPFGVKQFEEVMTGKNFLEVLSDQYVKVTTGSTDLAI